MAAQRTIAVREILAATDFSSQSSQAFDAALALAQHFGARLHVLHVATDASEQEIAEGKLKSLTAEQVEGVAIVKVVCLGQAPPEIVKYAQHEKIDLIVLGTHGRSGLARVLMGSVADAVVRTAPCQVLTIGPKVPAIEQASVPAKAAAEIPQSDLLRLRATALALRCLVCAKPSQSTICDACKAHIQGEAIERKRREEQPGHRGLSF
jgi:nucleotide-binding universal stress UspA family protein